MSTLHELIQSVTMTSDTEDQDVHWAAREALDEELRARRQQEPPTDPLLALIRQYGTMCANAVGEAEVGSAADATLIEARAELLLDEIAQQVQALRTPERGA